MEEFTSSSICARMKTKRRNSSNRCHCWIRSTATSILEEPFNREEINFAVNEQTYFKARVFLSFLGSWSSFEEKIWPKPTKSITEEQSKKWKRLRISVNNSPTQKSRWNARRDRRGRQWHHSLRRSVNRLVLHQRRSSGFRTGQISAR